VTTPLLGKVYSDKNGHYVVVDKSDTHVVLVGVFHDIWVHEPLRPKAGQWKTSGLRLTRFDFSRDLQRLNVSKLHPVVQARLDRRILEIMNGTD